MKGMSWIKLSCELFSNRKIQAIRRMERGDGYCLLWIYILVLSARVGKKGVLSFSGKLNYTAEDIALEGGFDVSLVKEGIELFLKYGMLKCKDGAYTVKNWLKYQNVVEYERKLSANRARVKRSREKKKAGNKEFRDTPPPLVENKSPAEHDAAERDADLFISGAQIALSENEVEKLRIQISDEDLYHYYRVVRGCIERGRKIDSSYSFIVGMATKDKRRKVDKRTGINRSFNDSMDRLKLPDEELDACEIAFKRALERSYGPDG